MRSASRRGPIAVVLTVAALGACDGGDTSTSTAVTVPPTAAPVSTSTSTTVTGSTTAPTSTTVVSPTTVAVSAPGLDSLLVPPEDLPFAATATPATPPTTACRVAIETVPMDAGARLLSTGDGAIAVSSQIEIYASPEVAAQAFSQRVAAYTACEWDGEMPASNRPTQVDGRLVDSPELVAAVPECAGAVSAGAVRTTTDDQPVVDRRELVMVIALCRDLVTTVRIDLLNQLPIDQLPWTGALVSSMLARVAAAV